MWMMDHFKWNQLKYYMRTVELLIKTKQKQKVICHNLPQSTTFINKYFPSYISYFMFLFYFIILILLTTLRNIVRSHTLHCFSIFIFYFWSARDWFHVKARRGHNWNLVHSIRESFGEVENESHNLVFITCWHEFGFGFVLLLIVSADLDFGVDNLQGENRERHKGCNLFTDSIRPVSPNFWVGLVH